AKARRYSEIRDQMRGIVRQMLAGKARELDAEAERVSKQLEELNAAELQRATAIQQQEGEQDRLNQRIYELDAEIRQNQNVLNLTALEVDRSENRIAFNRQRAEELAGRHAQVNAELSQATAQAVEWESRSTSQVQVVTLLREESGALTARVEELAKRAESRATQIAESEAKIEVLRRSSSEAGESLLRLHGEHKQAEEARVHQTESLRKLEANEHDLLETSMRARDDAQRAGFDHESATGQLNELKYVVVETYDHARAGVSILRDEVGRRATFFVDSLRNLRLSSEYEPIVNFRAEDGVISRLDKLVEFRDPLGPAAKQFLPRLRS